MTTLANTPGAKVVTTPPGSPTSPFHRILVVEDDVVIAGSMPKCWWSPATRWPRLKTGRGWERCKESF